MLCDKCQNIRLPHPPIKTTKRSQPHQHVCLVRHHATFDDLIASADEGCEICQYFRPFIEYARSRRHGLAERTQSDCSSSRAIGHTHDDPFGSINNGSAVASDEGGDILYTEREQPQYYIAPGRFYEYDPEDDKYMYLEDIEEWSARGTTEKSELIEADDARYRIEFRERLKKLGLDSDDGSQASGSGGKKVAGVTPEAKYADSVRAVRSLKYTGIQWALSTKDRVDEPEQLWIRLALQTERSHLAGGFPNDFCTVRLTAGSIEDMFDISHRPQICLNGVHGYTQYTLASLHPEIWKYRPNYLSIPQKRPKQNLHPVLEFYQLNGRTFSTSPPIWARDVKEDPADTSVLELARRWLAECVGSHEDCKLKGDPEVPTRLIDVGSDGDLIVKLHICHPEESSLRYATLSHCWGPDTSAISKLGREHIPKMTTEGICVSKLSRNFQDAITITRGLHLRYLWIDALCIMQDSEEDWAGEAAKMAQYYRASEVTISAVAAPNVQHGILLPRPVIKCPPRIDTEAGTLYLRPPLPDSMTVRDSDAYSDVRKPVVNLPLNKRAWTLQERMFSRRILYFTEDQMIWQCRKRFFAEDGQYSQQEEGYTEKWSRGIVDILSFGPRFVGKEKKPAPHSIPSTGWYALLKEYTQRKLTYPKDLLPAISGLAREIHHLTNIRYVAGLWLGTMRNVITGLMWIPVRDRHRYTPPKPVPSCNGSPSWSWTSLVAEVEFPFADDMTIVWKPGLDPKLVSAATFPATEGHPFGSVTGGQLTLECWIHDYGGVRTYNELLKKAAFYDWAESYNDVTSSDPDSPRADPFAGFDVEQPDDLWRPSRRRAFALAFIVYTNDFEDDGTEHAQQYFLLLERLPGHSTRFKRGGLGVTESGTLFPIDEDNGWTRRKISIV